MNFVRGDQFDESVHLPVAQSAVPLEPTAEQWVFLNLDSKGKLVGNLGNMALDTPEKIKLIWCAKKTRSNAHLALQARKVSSRSWWFCG